MCFHCRNKTDKKRSTDYYYTAPCDRVFHEVKGAALEIWKSYDPQTIGTKNKINRIERMENIRDNFMVIVAMFDIFNQRKLAQTISEDAKNQIRDRLKAGGAGPTNLNLLTFK